MEILDSFLRQQPLRSTLNDGPYLWLTRFTRCLARGSAQAHREGFERVQLSDVVVEFIAKVGTLMARNGVNTVWVEVRNCIPRRSNVQLVFVKRPVLAEMHLLFLDLRLS